MTQRCLECGHELPSNAQTCSECGCPVTPQLPPNRTDLNNNAEAVLVETTENILKWILRIVPVISGLVVLCGVIIGAIQMEYANAVTGFITIVSYALIGVFMYFGLTWFAKAGCAMAKVVANMSLALKNIETNIDR